MGVTAKPKTSRQNQKPHGKTKYLTAKSNTSQQNQKLHGKTKNLHGKTKNLTAKPSRVHGGSEAEVTITAEVICHPLACCM